MARIRISDLTSATLPVQTTSLVELSVVNGAAPSGYDSRKQTISNLPFLSTAGGLLSGNLSVTGNVSVTGGSNPLIITSPAATACNVTLGITSGRQYTLGVQADNTFILYDNTAVATRIIVSSAGACSASSTWSVISDSRLKEASSIEDYPRGLQEILALNPIYYQWNGKGGVPKDGELHYGLAAQDVEAVLPELIREHEYVPPEGSDDEPMTVKTYSPTDIVFSLIGAVKELQAQIDQLREQLPQPRSNTPSR